VIQPVVVAARKTGGWTLVAGERRWRAAQRAGLTEVPAVVREVADDRELLELALVENLQRADLNPIEEAHGYSDLIERHSYTQERLSEVIGKSRSHVSNTLRLLKLPGDVQALVREGKLSAGAARAIIGQKHVDVLAEQIVARGLNVREVEALVNDMQQNPPQGGGPPGLSGIGGLGRGGGSPAAARQPSAKDPDTAAFEKDLSDALGLKVEVRRGAGETGYLTIEYGNYEQLDHIRNRLIGR
jgi:ParB family chromosome partitioning protein